MSHATALLGQAVIKMTDNREPDPSDSRKMPCLRSNASMAVALVGLAVAVIFFGIGRGEGADTMGYIVAGILFLALAVLAYFQRSIERQVIRLDQENDELRETRHRLDQENKEFDEANKRLAQTENEIESDLKELKKVLETERAAAAEKLRRSEKQLQNLNKLHNDSVAMIRQLALYGDECKDFGKDLREVSSDLRETDESLGLSADELSAQVRALSAVAETLKKSSGASFA